MLKQFPRALKPKSRYLDTSLSSGKLVCFDRRKPFSVSGVQGGICSRLLARELTFRKVQRSFFAGQNGGRLAFLPGGSLLNQTHHATGRIWACDMHLIPDRSGCWHSWISQEWAHLGTWSYNPVTYIPTTSYLTHLRTNTRRLLRMPVEPLFRKYIYYEAGTPFIYTRYGSFIPTSLLAAFSLGDCLSACE